MRDSTRWVGVGADASRSPRGRDLILFALTYAALQEIALRLIPPGAGGSVFWPAAGLAFAALSIAHFRRWPALAAIVAVVNIGGNLAHGFALGSTLLFAVANTAEPVIGASFVRLWNRGAALRLSSLRDLSRFVLCGVLAGPMFAGVVGLLAFAAAGGDQSYGAAWISWVLADGTGVLAIAPVVLVWSQPSDIRIVGVRIAELLAVAVVPAAIAALVFLLGDGPSPSLAAFALLPVLVWGALRFGVVGVSAALPGTSVVTVLMTGDGYGPFATEHPMRDVHQAQLFLWAVAITTLIAGLITSATFRTREDLARRIVERAATMRATALQRLSAALVGAEDRAAMNRTVAELGPDCVHGTSMRLCDADLSAPISGLAERVVLAPVPGQRAAALDVTWDAEVDRDAGRITLPVVVQVVQAVLERVTALAKERRARERAEALEDVAAELARARTSRDVADIVVGRGLGRMFARGAVAIGSGDEKAEVLAAFPPERAAPAAFTVAGPDLWALPARELTRMLPEQVTPTPSPEEVLAARLALGDRQGVLVAADPYGDLDDHETQAYLDTLGQLCSEAIQRTFYFEAELEVSHVLQRSMLGRLPDLDDVELSARYEPAVPGLDVGGDWFDSFPLPNGKLALVIGDVVGRGLAAATAMGQLRSAVRAVACTGASPQALLDALDAFVQDVPVASFTTLVYAELDAESGALEYVCAGHPPPVIARADGSCVRLSEGLRPPLGRAPVRPWQPGRAVLPRGAVLALYTDGLVEDRHQSIDAGLEQLELHLATIGCVPLAGADDRLLETMMDGRDAEDDVCLLLARRTTVDARLQYVLPSVPAELRGMRAAVSGWLTARRVGAEDVSDLVLTVGELAANAIEHGSAAGDEITVQLDYYDHGIVRGSVADCGRWRPARPSFGGRGLRIVDQLVDAFDIDRRDTGTQVVFRRRVKQD